MMRGGTPAVAAAHDARQAPQAVLLGGLAGRHEQRGRAVVDARGVARGHGAGRGEEGFQARQLLEAGLPGMLVAIDDDGIALGLRDRPA
jgi:hypothetical protein